MQCIAKLVSIMLAIKARMSISGDVAELSAEHAVPIGWQHSPFFRCVPGPQITAAEELERHLFGKSQY
jgi:hypothetical protein